MDEYRKQDINFALGLLIIGGSLSFSVVETEVFKSFVKILNPSYQIPTRQTLSKTIVDKIQSKIIKAIKPQKINLKGTLMIDGWKNTSNNTKTVTAIVKPENCVEIFLKSYDFSSTSEDHQNLLNVVYDASKLSDELFGVKINSFVSDNAANMIKTGKESNLIAYGCKAHVGNLYVNDVFDKTIYNQVHEIMVQYRNTTLQQLVKENNGHSIYLANDTRWKVRTSAKRIKICIFLLIKIFKT